MRDVPVQDVVFMDESAVNLGLIRLFAWALQGECAPGEPPKRGQHVSLVAGLSLTGIVGCVSRLGAGDGLTFETVVATRLVPN